MEAIRRGHYTDQYFNHIARVLAQVAKKYPRGESQSDSFSGDELHEIGNIHGEMQFFNKREPSSVVVGLDYALTLLELGCGYWDGDEFVNTYHHLEVEALYDGEETHPRKPVLRIRGRYRDYGYLETVILGGLTRMSKIATNVYRTLEATGGKPVLYFSARFDMADIQKWDGYAYKIAVDRYNHLHGTSIPTFISTDVQGRLYDGEGGGTTAHAYLVCFMKDTAEAMYHFADLMPDHVKRIALVDVNNDCIADSLATARRLFFKYRELAVAGQTDEAEKFRLYGVRPDNAESLRDYGIPPLGDPQLDCGVTPRLVWALREALDEAPELLDLEGDDLEEARKYYRGIKIFCTGGFHPEKIALFERLEVPADGYGVGSYFINGPGCNYTADLVQVKWNGEWLPMGKVGRERWENQNLHHVADEETRN